MCCFKQVVYLMDRFNVSGEFYHELSMFLPATLRSYHIKKVRTQQNKSLKTRIHRVPTPHHGVYCSIKERLCDEIGQLVSSISVFTIQHAAFHANAS